MSFTQAPNAPGALGWSAIAISGLALTVLAFQVMPLYYALTAPSAGVGDVREAVKEQAEKHASSFDAHLAQIKGRQLFLLPAPSSAVVEETSTDEEPDTPREPVKPATYGGPGVIAMINDSVWFANGTQVAKGQESDGIKVIDVDAPWNAQIVWRGVEFTVNLFERDGVIFRDRADTADKPSANIVRAAPTPEPTAAELKAAEAKVIEAKAAELKAAKLETEAASAATPQQAEPIIIEVVPSSPEPPAQPAPVEPTGLTESGTKA